MVKHTAVILLTTTLLDREIFPLHFNLKSIDSNHHGSFAVLMNDTAFQIPCLVAAKTSETNAILATKLSVTDKQDGKVIS